MRNILRITSLVVLVVLAVSAMLLGTPAHAQTPDATPTAAPPQPADSGTTGAPAPVVIDFTNPNLVTFSQIQGIGRTGDIIMTSPYDSDGITFAIPANWELQDGAELNLRLNTTFNALFDIQTQSKITVIGGGTLNVFLNDVLLSSIPLSEVGEIEKKITIPSSAFQEVRSDGIHVLWFRLESSESCRFVGQDTTVYIHPTSYLSLPHNEIQPSTNLIDFPKPLIQNTFFPDHALLIVPDQPTSADLQAALTVAAGLGKLSAGELVMNLITVSGLNNTITTGTHVVFIGKGTSLPDLSGLGLPLAPQNGRFPLAADGAEDGLIQMVVSPWSPSHALLLVSANTDQGLIKAARAVSTGLIRPAEQNNYALIKEVNLEPLAIPTPVDRTLADLGYEGRVFAKRGYNSESYVFKVPPGMTASTESYFEIVYGHSALINFNSSQIILYLNGQPIGSVRLDASTAVKPTNTAKIMIPPAAILPGDNRLDVVVNMIPVDDCTPPDSRDLWVNVWAQSLLHLPLVTSPSPSSTANNLVDYPAPFTYDPALATTAFVLERDDLQTWNNAVQIASFLGYSASGTIVELAAFYGDELSDLQRSSFDLLVMGRPSALPLVLDMNDSLPAPFSAGSNIAEESNFQVTYRVPPDSPMGYIQSFKSPWNSNHAALAILGNTTTGVNWAARALVDPILRADLAGNFAVVNDTQILTTEIIFPAVADGQANDTQSPYVQSAPAAPASTRPHQTTPLWVLPALAASGGLLLLILLVLFIRRRLADRPRKNLASVKHISSAGHEPGERD